MTVPPDSSLPVRGRVVRKLLRNPLGISGGVLLLIVLVGGVFAPVLAPYPPAEVHFTTPFQQPGTVGFDWAPTTSAATCSPACCTGRVRRWRSAPFPCCSRSSSVSRSDCSRVTGVASTRWFRGSPI